MKLTKHAYSFFLHSAIDLFEIRIWKKARKLLHGKVDRKDAVLILKNISGMALDKFSTENADYNGDGVINSLDVIAIMKSI